MIQSAIHARLLQRDHVAGLLDDAQLILAAALILADFTELRLREIVAVPAIADVLLDRANGVGQLQRLARLHTQNVIRDPLGGLLADSRQASELVHKTSDGLGNHSRSASSASS